MKAKYSDILPIYLMFMFLYGAATIHYVPFLFRGVYCAIIILAMLLPLSLFK